MCKPTFPTPLAEETVFSPLYSLASFVEDWLLVVGVWAYFWDLASVPFIHCLFSCQYHAILITVALYCLKSGRVMPPALFFFLRIALAIVDLYGSIYILGVLVLVLWKMSRVIWLIIVLNLWIASDNSHFSNINSYN